MSTPRKIATHCDYGASDLQGCGSSAILTLNSQIPALKVMMGAIDIVQLRNCEIVRNQKLTVTISFKLSSSTGGADVIPIVVDHPATAQRKRFA